MERGAVPVRANLSAAALASGGWPVIGFPAMPFDTTKLRQPTVTVLPPTPPDRGDGPRRIHVQIEIVDRRQKWANSRRAALGGNAS